MRGNMLVNVDGRSEITSTTCKQFGLWWTTRTHRMKAARTMRSIFIPICFKISDSFSSKARYWAGHILGLISFTDFSERCNLACGSGTTSTMPVCQPCPSPMIPSSRRKHTCCSIESLFHVVFLSNVSCSVIVRSISQMEVWNPGNAFRKKDIIESHSETGLKYIDWHDEGTLTPFLGLVSY